MDDNGCSNGHKDYRPLEQRMRIEGVIEAIGEIDKHE